MPTDRGTAVAAATRIKQGVERKDNTSYTVDYLSRDAWLAADYLLTPFVPETGEREGGDTDDGPDNPVSPEFLRLVGFADPTMNGNVWTIQDVDGREMKYLFVGETGEAECHLLDDEGEGCRVPPPDTEGDVLELCRLLHFPAELPVG